MQRSISWLIKPLIFLHWLRESAAMMKTMTRWWPALRKKPLFNLLEIRHPPLIGCQSWKWKLLHLPHIRRQPMDHLQTPPRPCWKLSVSSRSYLTVYTITYHHMYSGMSLKRDEEIIGCNIVVTVSWMVVKDCGGFLHTKNKEDVSPSGAEKRPLCFWLFTTLVIGWAAVCDFCRCE